MAQTNDFIRKIWLPRTLMSAGRYTRESAIQRAEETGELIAFGRRFISNVCRCNPFDFRSSFSPSLSISPTFPSGFAITCRLRGGPATSITRRRTPMATSTTSPTKSPLRQRRRLLPISRA